MKKIFLFIIAASFTIINASAQNVRFGIFTNPVISWMNTDVSYIDPNGNRFGINVGLMIDRFFTNHYAFSTGISIRSMGGTLKYNNGKSVFRSSGDVPALDPGTSLKYKLQYLHIPLSIKLKTTEIGYTTYFAHLGLDPMVNIKANADVPSVRITNTGIGDEINTFYLGYHIGAGIEYRIIGNTALIAGVTYMNGFTDITDNNGNSTEKTVLHAFEFNIGVIF